MTEQQTDSSEQHPVKIEKFPRHLRVKLSDREIVERAQRAAHLGTEVEQQEEELKAAQKQAKARIEEIDAERRRLNLEVLDGAVHREVQCERRFIYRTGVVQELRTDTGDLLNERPMSERERQPDLPGVHGSAEDDDEPTEGPTNWTPDETDATADETDDGIVDDDYDPDATTDEPVLETAKPKKRGGRRKSASTEAE